MLCILNKNTYGHKNLTMLLIANQAVPLCATGLSVFNLLLLFVVLCAFYKNRISCSKSSADAVEFAITSSLVT